MLYVVGATTFLLVKELRREAPTPVDLDEVANAQSLRDVARQVERLDAELRSAAALLKSNDERAAAGVEELAKRVNSISVEATKLAAGVRGDIEDLYKLTLETSQRAGLLQADVALVLKEQRAIGNRVVGGEGPGGGAPEPGTGGGPGPTVQAPPATPSQSAEEIERERARKAYVEQLTADRGAKTNQVRYNAAVQLGDLKDPAAVPALIDALNNDPYDLVRRAAAWSLSMFGKDAVPAIPALIEQIGGKEEYVGYMCERALGEITKAVTGTAVSFNFDPTMNASQRRKVQKKWEEWWDKSKDAFGA
jgi:HEAT repeat protein